MSLGLGVARHDISTKDERLSWGSFWLEYICTTHSFDHVT